ncbi:MAG: type I-U CRISPR-associated protein Csx17 [Planctomycetota bacterium]|nr:MAG: type I-U CRISPR-associated protein Csx17 [Planctomycetota bacterium]
MAEPTRHDLELPGCTPEPLMAYLKALGILRLVAEQKDPDARGWWRNDVFCLRSTLDRDALVRFFLEEYKPTPLFSPWNGDGGFLSDSGTSVATINWFREDANARFQGIRDAIAAVGQIPLMSEFRQNRERAKELEKKKKARTITEAEKEELKAVSGRVKQIKQNVVTTVRAGFPDSALSWLDCCLTIGLEGFAPSPLLGSGGVDGHLDFGNNFLINCRALLEKPDDRTKARLENALFATPVALEASSIGQFSPGQIGAPNSTQGFEGDSQINPWDFLLMMEGTLLLAGAAMRRFGIADSARPAFPFTVRAVAAGFDSPASKDEAESRGELWLPLWTRPTSVGELRQLFGEGRADVSGRAARDGADFARAVAGLGVDRGITGFNRLGFLKRSGKAFLAAPLGRFEVVERGGVDLLREVDTWLERFRRAAGDKSAPPRFGSALRRIDSAIFNFCKYGGAAFFQQILVALGAAERELANAERFREEKRLNPLAGLSSAWFDAASDGTAEFAIARGIAGVQDAEGRIGPLRANLETVDWTKRCRAWAEKDRAVVWNAADLATNLSSILTRRMMDGARAGCERLPLASSHAASLEAIAAFIAGELDDHRIEELIWGLMLIDTRRRHPARAGMNQSRDRQGPGSCALPREYALLKLLFLPRPLVPERSDQSVKWRLACRLAGGRIEDGLIIRPEPRILPLLRAGRVGEACRIAAQRLRVSGLGPMPGPLPTGVMRDDNWSECAMDSRRAQRLAAALLIPISSKSVNCLVDLVCRGESAAAEALALAAEGETE